MSAAVATNTLAAPAIHDNDTPMAPPPLKRANATSADTAETIEAVPGTPSEFTLDAARMVSAYISVHGGVPTVTDAAPSTAVNPKIGALPIRDLADVTAVTDNGMVVPLTKDVTLVGSIYLHLDGKVDLGNPPALNASLYLNNVPFSTGPVFLGAMNVGGPNNSTYDVGFLAIFHVTVLFRGRTLVMNLNVAGVGTDIVMATLPDVGPQV